MSIYGHNVTTIIVDDSYVSDQISKENLQKAIVFAFDFSKIEAHIMDVIVSGRAIRIGVDLAREASDQIVVTAVSNEGLYETYSAYGNVSKGYSNDKSGIIVVGQKAFNNYHAPMVILDEPEGQDTGKRQFTESRREHLARQRKEMRKRGRR